MWHGSVHHPRNHVREPNRGMVALLWRLVAQHLVLERIHDLEGLPRSGARRVVRVPALDYEGPEGCGLGGAEALLRVRAPRGAGIAVDHFCVEIGLLHGLERNGARPTLVADDAECVHIDL